MIWPIAGAALVALAATVGIGSKYYFTSLKDDNIIEEICEEYIDYQTGFELDLTPLSPEPSKEKEIDENLI